MFDFLKKKIADFTGKIKDALKAKPAGPQPPEQIEAAGQAVQEEAAPIHGQAPTPAAQGPAHEGKEPAKKEGPIPQQPKAEEKKAQAQQAPQPAQQQAAYPPKTEKTPPAKILPTPKSEAPSRAPVKNSLFLSLEKRKNLAPFGARPRPRSGQGNAGEKEREPLKQNLNILSITIKKPGPAKPQITEPEFEIAGEKRTAIEKATQIREDERRELKAKVGLVSKIFGFVGGKIKITEKETQDFFDEFELSLLEADVQQDAAGAIVRELQGRLVGKEISSREDVTGFLKREVKGSLAKIMETVPIDVLALCAGDKPLKIMFFGPNGAGKTTSIAKIANYFMKRKKSVILAAGDTFRAASIEQLEAHANALGVKVVKHKYGSDPAAVAFDAVKAAEAKGIDVVLIDTAGRQETNKNLLEELRKIERVIKPDLKLYVGEAFTGQALLQQAMEFDRAIGLSGFVLTKIDADTKGGTAISLLYSLKKPIVFVGTGQRYDDLLEFRPEFIIDRII